MQSYFTHLAGYNAWANRRLYEAAGKLSQEQLWRDAGLFFKSVGGTLNHILVADRVWMKRFTGTGDHPTKLSAIIHEDFGQLRAAREAEDARIADWVATLDDARLAGELKYQMMTRPDFVTSVLWTDLIHFFNHETHHRGQAHTGLSILTGEEPPSLDLILFTRGIA